MLLTRTGGVAIHLTQSADDSDDRQPAVPFHRWPSAQPDDTDTFTNLTDQRWAPRTLCGIRWHLMAGTDSTAAGTDDDRTPTCRRCLGILDRWFPEPVPDERIGRRWISGYGAPVMGGSPQPTSDRNAGSRAG
jgi:hypothetical protein